MNTKIQESSRHSSRYGDCSQKCKIVGAKGRIIAMMTTESVNRVLPPTRGKNTDSYRKFSGRCYCGRAGHKHQQSRHKEAVCHHCGKTGLVLRACRYKSLSQRRNRQQPRKRSVHHVEGGPEGDTDDDFTLYSINSAYKPSPYIVDIEINGKAFADENRYWSFINARVRRHLQRELADNKADTHWNQVALLFG